MKIIEHFVSIQGEGVRAGRPSLFIRVVGCNLRCVFRNPKGKVASICDTSYASFENPPATETEEEALASIFSILNDTPGITDVVITGGEPLLDMDGIVELLAEIRTLNPCLMTTIETNGTILPDPRLYNLVDLWSVSPKLSTSVPRPADMKKYGITEAQCKYHAKNRINPVVLADIATYSNDIQLKFVYSGEDCIAEIEDIVKKVQAAADKIAPENVDVNRFVMLMPEGITSKAITSKTDEVVKICIERGWMFSTRLHILIWGNVKEK